MASEFDGFACYTFLDTSVTSEGDDVVVKDFVLRCVVNCCCALAAHGVSDCVADALTEWSCGGFYAWCLVKFWVTWCDGMELTEVFDVLE